MPTVLIPVKGFGLAKGRLADRLNEQERAELARSMATRVVRAAGSLPVQVVCDDEDVAAWARTVGAQVLHVAADGLNPAVAAALDVLEAAADAGAEPGHVLIAHADLPHATSLAGLAEPGTVTIVPDRHLDGTNVMSLPLGTGFEFHYGPGSFAAHCDEAMRCGLELRVRRVAELEFDIDTPDDLDAAAVFPPLVASQPSSTGTFTVDLPTPASALVIAAHPDDAEFNCGATLAKWAASGTVVHYFVCTDGSKGTWDPDCDQAELVQIRRVEQSAAAQALGATGEVRFGDHVDGELGSDLATRAQVAQVIRELTPAVVLGHDPWKRYRLHPDHRHAGLLAVEGIVAARDPHYFSEQISAQDLAPHRPDELLLFEADEPDHAENVDDWIDTKTAALLCHKSQFVTTHGISGPDDDAGKRRFADWVSAVAVASGQQAGLGCAELFKRIDNL